MAASHRAEGLTPPQISPRPGSRALAGERAPAALLLLRGGRHMASASMPGALAGTVIAAQGRQRKPPRGPLCAVRRAVRQRTRPRTRVQQLRVRWPWTEHLHAGRPAYIRYAAARRAVQHRHLVRRARLRSRACRLNVRRPGASRRRAGRHRAAPRSATWPHAPRPRCAVPAHGAQASEVSVFRSARRGRPQTPQTAGPAPRRPDRASAARSWPHVRRTSMIGWPTPGGRVFAGRPGRRAGSGCSLHSDASLATSSW